MMHIPVDADFFEKLNELRKAETARTGWDITTVDIIRRAVKIMEENNKLEVEK